jgi:hypothetical protein
MKATTQIWEGGLVALDSSGRAVPATTSTSLIVVGVAMESKLSGSVDNADTINVHEGRFLIPTDTAFTRANIGAVCYAVNDNQVSMTSTGRSIAGVVAQLDDAATGNSVWVSVGLVPPNEDAALTAFEAELAATGTGGQGANLVGVQDADSNFGATPTVEGALKQLAEQPKYVVSIPIPAYSAIANSGVLARFKPLTGGRIIGMRVQATTAVTTGSKLATLTPNIAGSPVTGGVVSMTSAGQNAIGAAQDGTAVTATNTFTASQEITVVASSVTAFVEGAGVIFVDIG